MTSNVTTLYTEQEKNFMLMHERILSVIYDPELGGETSIFEIVGLLETIKFEIMRNSEG